MNIPAHTLLYLAFASSMPVAIRLGIEQGWSSHFLGLSRFSFVFVFFALIALARKWPLFGSTGDQRRNAFIAAVLRGVNIAGFYTALSLIPASRVVVICSAAPLLNLFCIRWLLRHDPITSRHWQGMSLGFIGLALILLDRNPESAGGMSLSGDIMALAQALLFKLSIIYEKRALEAGSRPAQLTATSSLGAVFTFFILLLIDSSPLSFEQSTSAWATLFYLAIPGGALWLFYRKWLTGKLRVSYLNALSYPSQLLSIFAAMFFLGETISLLASSAFLLSLLGSGLAARASLPRDIENKTDSHQPKSLSFSPPPK